MCIEVTFVEAAVVDSIFFSYKIDGSVMATVSTFETTSYAYLIKLVHFLKRGCVFIYDLEIFGGISIISQHNNFRC